MPSIAKNDNGEYEHHQLDYSSGSDDYDDVWHEDMEEIKRACMVTDPKHPSSGDGSGGLPPDSDSDDGDLELVKNLQKRFGIADESPQKKPSFADLADASVSDSDSDSDLELARNIQRRFASGEDFPGRMSMEPLSVLPPPDSDGEDDFETLRAIERRFAAYNGDASSNGIESFFQKPEQVCVSSIASEKEIPHTLFVDRTNASEGPPVSEDVCSIPHSLNDNNEVQPSALTEFHPSDASGSPTLSPKHSSFPQSARLLIDAIKKNRSSQKFIRSKMVRLEAKIEENKKLRERVKVLRDFQISCKKKTGRALSQKMDPCVQLISARKLKPSTDSKATEKRVSAMSYGPPENSHVSNYRMALEKFPVSLSREKWSEEERKNIGKGIRQQFQEMMLQHSMDQLSCSEGSPGDPNSIDEILSSIKDLDLTPERMREFLPKVNWEQLASMYVPGRSAAECEARWLNWEDPLLNHSPWTAEEDKMLLSIIQEKGLNNWFDIAVLLGTNRTPFQCLARYQRSLNASILKREWTKEEDDQLRIAVEAFGESDWQSVASTLEGRTGTQCSNRWKKSLIPARKRVGRWTSDEDKHLKVAVMLFGPKNWNKIANFVPGRTQVQCRERWVNSLDPSLNWNKWTEEEDMKLEAAIAEHGYCWSKVASCVPPRTDNQCRRRWKVLFPDEVPLLQEARKIEKAAFIGNFVDRESERPALRPDDFRPLALISSAEQYGDANSSRKERSRLKYQKEKVATPCVPRVSKTTRSRSVRDKAEIPGENNANHKKLRSKRTRSKSCLDSVPSVVTRDKGSDGFAGYNASNTKFSESYSNRNSSQTHMLPPETVESATSNDSADGLFGSNCITSKRKKASKLHSKKSVVTAEASDHQNSSWSSGVSMLTEATSGSEPGNNNSSLLDPDLLVINNGQEVDELTTGKGLSKPCSKARMLKRKVSRYSNSSSPPEILSVRIAKGNNGGEPMDRATLNKRKITSKRGGGRKSRNEQFRDCQGYAAASCLQNRQTPEEEDLDDTVLACYHHKMSKKRKCEAAKTDNQGRSCDVKDSEVFQSKDTDECHDGNQIVSNIEKGGTEDTLACFIRSKSKKRKCGVAKTSNQDFPSLFVGESSELPSQSTDEMLPSVKSETHCNVSSAVNLLPSSRQLCLDNWPTEREADRVDPHKCGTSTYNERGHEPESNNRGECDVDDEDTLACFLLKKSKRRDKLAGRRM